MNGRHWKRLGAGLWAGLVAAILMTLALLALRFLFGVATPSELVGDRIAPLLPVETFIDLLVRFGGYNNLKMLGVSSVLGGQLIAGALGGLAYASVVERASRRQPAETSQRGPYGLWFVALFVGALWLLSLLLLWPVVGTSYVGLPPGKATLANACALLFAYALYGFALAWLYHWMTGRADASEGDVGEHQLGRRAVVAGGVGVVLALAVGGLLRRLYTLATFSYDGTQYKGPDVQAITPNERFYVVTKNVIDPDVTASLWRLQVTGLVNDPQMFRFEDLTAMPAITQETTLRCISNEVGGGLMSNAVWKGVPLRSLIERAGPQPGIIEVMLHGVDNYTDTFAFEKALDPTTLVVYEMNGQPLPEKHGYPVRVIVPGLFGEKNVKWVTRIELVDHDAKGFYERQGWGPNFVVPTAARFDQPENKKKISMDEAAAGVQLKGVAHSSRGISRVEVSLDDGQTWNEAQIVYTRSPLAWVLWSYDWRPTQPGEYKLAVRATDNNGELQTDKERWVVPEGATGYHKITVPVAT
ncbi:MAG: molybdopterin-dependent oxidoreductase [Pyrinomonadaceae bacterium]